MTHDLFGAVPPPDAAALAARLCGGSATAWARAFKRGANGNVRAFLTLPRPALEAAGVEPDAVERFGAVRELAQQYGEDPWRIGEQFADADAVFRHFRERLAAAPVENFVVLCLDNKHRLLRELWASRGSATASIVHPRDVLRPVILEGAAAVIFVHNHPSGDPTPSREDVEITNRLREVCDLCGIRALDHVVIGKGRFVSFVNDGYW